MRKLGAEAALEYGRGGQGRVDAIAIPDYRDEIKDILADLYARTAESMAKHIRDSAKSVLERLETKDIDVTLERLLELFQATALNEAKLIAETMKEEVKIAIEGAVAEGAGEAEIGRSIRQRVDALAPWQARRIARTETLMASSQSQFEIVNEMDDMPALAKEWDSSRDSRTRRDHRGVRPVPKDEMFRVGGKLMKYPGDRRGGPEQVINCRCAVSFAPMDQMDELEAEVEDRLADIEEDETFQEEQQGVE